MAFDRTRRPNHLDHSLAQGQSASDVQVARDWRPSRETGGRCLISPGRRLLIPASRCRAGTRSQYSVVRCSGAGPSPLARDFHIQKHWFPTIAGPADGERGTYVKKLSSSADGMKPEFSGGLSHASDLSPQLFHHLLEHFPSGTH